MTRPHYTLDDIKAAQARLAADMHAREQRLQRKWAALVTPPTFNNRFSLWANRANAAFSIYDGFMTGFKLLHTFGAFLRRKKKRSSSHQH